MTRQVIVFLDDLDGLIDSVLLAFNGETGVVQMGPHAQSVFEQTHVLVERAKEGFDLSGDMNGTSHPSGGLACYRNGLADGEFLLVEARPRGAISRERISTATNAGETPITLAQRKGRVKLRAFPCVEIAPEWSYRLRRANEMP